MAQKKYGIVKDICNKKFIFLLSLVLIISILIIAKNNYTKVDFGKTFNSKAIKATKKLQELDTAFALCSQFCNKEVSFMKSIVFPEVMRYNSIKDGIETESLHVLYVELGDEYANHSIGLFQMKPSFALQVEQKAKQVLSDSLYKELQLSYDKISEAEIRQERVNRLQDNEYQMVYLTAFILICDAYYKHKFFNSKEEKLQWYATIYNAGFDKKEDYISKKINENNFYLSQGMPHKKFQYAAIVKWFYISNKN